MPRLTYHCKQRHELGKRCPTYRQLFDLRIERVCCFKVVFSNRDLQLALVLSERRLGVLERLC